MRFTGDTFYLYLRKILLRIDRDPQNALLKEHPENWFNVNLWGSLRDLIIRNVPGFDNIRSETCSKSSSKPANGWYDETETKYLKN
ncbi:12656_t:CDS:2 [Entrophospora sp. SA101]|nr:12656_t:CDS:2 [Entrophospora sp. SA101]